MKLLGKLLCCGAGLAMLAACGGGGGSASSGAVSYTGVASQATVTTANALDLSVNAYDNGNLGSLANVAGIQAPGATVPAVSGPTIAQVGNALTDSLSKAIKIRLANPGDTAAAGVTVQQSVTGNYSGSASFTMNLNETTGAFSGQLTFNALKDHASDPAISGTVTATGVYDNSSQTFTSLTLSFSPLTASTAGGTVKLYGSMTAQNLSTGSFTVTCYLQATTGKVYWIKGWTYSYDASNSLTVTGSYYDPAYGFVQISTPVPLAGSSSTGEPTSGTVDFAGAIGSKAELSYTATGYTLTVHAADGADFILTSGQWQAYTP